MKSRTFPAPIFISIIALVLSVVAFSYSMGKSPASRPAIGFIDFQAVVQQSDAGKSIREQVEPKRLKLQEAAEAKLKELRQEQDELKKQGNTSAEANAALQKKIDDWNVEAQRQQAALDAAVNPAMQELEKALRAQVNDMATDNKVSAILPMQSAFYTDRALDLTSEAIRRLNKSTPEISVKFADAK